jgi:hypothetical protein
VYKERELKKNKMEILRVLFFLEELEDDKIWKTIKRSVFVKNKEL